MSDTRIGKETVLEGLFRIEIYYKDERNKREVEKALKKWLQDKLELYKWLKKFPSVKLNFGIFNPRCFLFSTYINGIKKILCCHSQ